MVDDLEGVDPCRPRGIELRGAATTVHRPGMFGDGEYLEIAPRIAWSWVVGGNDSRGGGFTPRKAVWGDEA